jgi:Spo7-like protein
MSDSRLDQIVKGAAPPAVKPPPTIPLQNISSASTAAPDVNIPSQQISDPLSSLPSSPPQIYLNLLILESSLRAQYLQLLSRRRLHTFFVFLLSLWTGGFTYLLFLRPREDGLGLGGSVYWVVETMEKVALMGGAVTVILFWGTGQWERGIRWPRRWVGTTNRGLRGFNLRVVVMRGPWWKEWPRHLAFLFPTMNLQSSGSEWHLIEYSSGQHGGRNQHPHHGGPGRDGDEEAGSLGMAGGLVEEDLAPGGDYIKLLLLPKSFSPEFRENWEEYRTDYWERENERRALLRSKSKQQRRARAQHEGGWMWWTGMWRTRKHLPKRDVEKHAHHLLRPQPSDKDAKVAARRRSFLRSESNHSRQSSRSSTPALDGDEKPGSERVRRGSSAASARRKAKDRGGTSLGRPNISPLTKTDEGRESRPPTPGSDSSSTFGRSTPA